MRTGRLLGGFVLLLTGCTAPAVTSPPPPPSSSLANSSPNPSANPSVTPTQAPRRPTASPTPERTGPDDPRWRFFVSDRTRYRSKWFAGAQRVMIGYGCTDAPYYPPDRRCKGTDGFHHGIDVALPCRTAILAGVDGRVIGRDRPGRPGPAYGSTAFRLRVAFGGQRYDVLVGHATRVLVEPGDRVRAGDRIATAGARGAPDGCHLHFEQRRVDGGVFSAVDPARLLGLRAG